MDKNSEKCNIRVAVNIRPLLAVEQARSCKECVAVNPCKPQLQIGSRCFTFDHVYANTASTSSALFEDCVAPLVHGLFHGYNATVLAYGQTGSGKTYTMGTAYKQDSQHGLIPQVFDALFNEIYKLRHLKEFNLHVSFIEILNEKVRDLLAADKSLASSGHDRSARINGRPCIQIRESYNGGIIVSGVSKIAVSTIGEMIACLHKGSLGRATGSTNMNNQSSRSHAIFTITLEQVRKTYPLSIHNKKDVGEEHFIAKLHLVDLAGSERAKKTGSDGLQSKEGIHINRGLLALGKVITALTDEKSRKAAHIPYRDSKLTRLLQDSLGGNSRTVLIACISPTEVDADESLSTLNYASRARYIQSKPVANGDLITSKLKRLNQQCAREDMNELQVLKEKVARLEERNEELCQEISEFHSKYNTLTNVDAEIPLGSERNGMKGDSQILDSCVATSGQCSGDTDGVTIEVKHPPWQNMLDHVKDASKRSQGGRLSSSHQPDAKMDSGTYFGGMLKNYYGAFTLMASCLSEAEHRDRAGIISGENFQLRFLAEAKELLHYMFSTAKGQRCRICEEKEIEDTEEQFREVTMPMRAIQIQSNAFFKEQKRREQTVAIALATSSVMKSSASHSQVNSRRSSPNKLLTSKHFQFTPAKSHGPLEKMPGSSEETRELSINKVAAAGRLWKLRKSSRQRVFELKLNWQKPWKLSEWIKHCDETLIPPGSYKKSLIDVI